MSTGQHYDPRALESGDEGDVLTTVGGIPAWAPPAEPTRRVPLTTVGPDGPGIVFAADGHIIYVEEP